MKLGRIIGRVVSTVKVESIEGLKLVLLQQLDEKLENIGTPIVAADNIRAGIGSLVYYETSVEASRIYETHQNPIDAAVMAIVEELDIEN